MSHPSPPPAAAPSFEGRIGVARRDITPPLEIYARNWGAATHDRANTLHRPLTATLLTIEEIGAEGEPPPSGPLFLISLDLGWWKSHHEEKLLRERFCEALNTTPERVMFALSHTHAGPSFCLEDTAHPAGGSLIAPYLDHLCTTLAEAAREALASAVPALLESAQGWSNLARNRDLPDPERPRWLVGWNPTAESDATLLLGRVTRRDNGEPLALVVNYACHPTILAWENETLSPDYPGALREVVEGATGVPLLFLQGASGELAPAHQYTGDPAVADRAGRQLGHHVLATLHGMLPPARQLVYRGARESGAPLALWREEERTSQPRTLRVTHLPIPLALRDDLPDLATLREALSQADETTDPVTTERLRRKLRIRESLGNGSTYLSQNLLWELGEIAIAAIGNEAYSCLQRELRAATPERALFIATIVNETRGYLPPATLYGQDHYTIWQTPFAPGGLEEVITAFRQALTGEPAHPAPRPPSP